MAIRLPLPPTLFPRLRLSWRATQSYFASQTQAIQACVGHAAHRTRTRWQRLLETAGSYFNLRTRARQRQRAQFQAFEQHYEDLIDLLCLAAHEGIRPERSEKYGRLRAWMCANYHRIRPRLRKHWEIPGETPCDPFEPLFASENLAEIVNASTGIEDIMQSRMALEAYRAELDSLSLGSSSGL